MDTSLSALFTVAGVRAGDSWVTLEHEMENRDAGTPELPERLVQDSELSSDNTVLLRRVSPGPYVSWESASVDVIRADWQTAFVTWVLNTQARSQHARKRVGGGDLVHKAPSQKRPRCDRIDGAPLGGRRSGDLANQNDSCTKCVGPKQVNAGCELPLACATQARWGWGVTTRGLSVRCAHGSCRNLRGHCDPCAQQHGGNRRRVGRDLAAVPLSRVVALPNS